MSNFAPLHYRKLRIAEHGAFALLPLYVRCFGEGLKKLCDDRGRIVLDGKAPADVIARRGGAETNERRRIAADVTELIRVGWLRHEGDALVVVEQEQDWEQLDSSRALNMRPSSSRRASERRPTRSQLAPDLRHDVARNESSARNHSADPLASDKIRSIRSDQEEKREEQKRAEGVQGDQAPYAPKTDPTPTLRRQKLDEALGKGSESWGFEGQDVANQSERLKDLEANTPPQERPVPSPPRARQAPLVTVVEPKPAKEQNPPSKGTAKPKAKGRRGSVGGEHPIPEDWTVNEANYEHGAKFYGYTHAHVDAEAQAFRDQYAANGKTYVDWDAHFRTFMRWQSERRYGKPPFVPAPVEPKRPMPPCPPPEPHIVEAAKRWGERMANGEKIDFKAMRKNVGMQLPPLPPDPPELAQWRREDGMDP